MGSGCAVRRDHDLLHVLASSGDRVGARARRSLAAATRTLRSRRADAQSPAPRCVTSIRRRANIFCCIQATALQSAALRASTNVKCAPSHARCAAGNGRLLVRALLAWRTLRLAQNIAPAQILSVTVKRRRLMLAGSATSGALQAGGSRQGGLPHPPPLRRDSDASADARSVRSSARGPAIVVADRPRAPEAALMAEALAPGRRDERCREAVAEGAPSMRLGAVASLSASESSTAAQRLCAEGEATAKSAVLVAHSDAREVAQSAVVVPAAASPEPPMKASRLSDQRVLAVGRRGGDAGFGLRSPALADASVPSGTARGAEWCAERLRQAMQSVTDSAAVDVADAAGSNLPAPDVRVAQTAARSESKGRSSPMLHAAATCRGLQRTRNVRGGKLARVGAASLSGAPTSVSDDAAPAAARSSQHRGAARALSESRIRSQIDRPSRAAVRASVRGARRATRKQSRPSGEPVGEADTTCTSLPGSDRGQSCELASCREPPGAQCAQRSGPGSVQADGACVDDATDSVRQEACAHCESTRQPDKELGGTSVVGAVPLEACVTANSSSQTDTGARSVLQLTFAAS